MPETIQQSVTLPARAAELYRMYLDPELHAAITGAPVVIRPEPGAEFRAFDGTLTGRILQTVPERLIVQSWRAKAWTPDDLDSTLVLTFWPEGDAGRIDLVHVNVADHDFEGVNEGWAKFYWEPWREYLGGRG